MQNSHQCLHGNDKKNIQILTICIHGLSDTGVDNLATALLSCSEVKEHYSWDIYGGACG